MKVVRFPWVQQPLVGQIFLFFEASQSYSGTLNSVGLFWKNDESVAETFTRYHTTLTRGEPMETTGFETEIPVSERPQTHSLDRAATGIGRWMEKVVQNVKKSLRE
jgi:hypothetical protein